MKEKQNQPFDIQRVEFGNNFQPFSQWTIQKWRVRAQGLSSEIRYYSSDFYLEGIGRGRIELQPTLSGDPLQEEINPLSENKILGRDEKGQLILADLPFEVAVEVEYEDSKTVDPKFRCILTIGVIQLVGDNKEENNVEQAGLALFYEWKTETGELICLHVPPDQIIQEISIRFEKKP